MVRGVQNNFQWLFSASFASLRSSAVGRTFFSTVSTVFNLFLSNLATPNYWKSKIILYTKQFSTNHGHIVLSSGVLYRGDVLQCFRVRLLDLGQQLRAWFTVGHSTKSIEKMNISSCILHSNTVPDDKCSRCCWYEAVLNTDCSVSGGSR